MQHEVRTAGSSHSRRLRAQALGYAALARLVLAYPLAKGGPMRRLLATLLLGSVGSALLVVAFSRSTIGPVQAGPFFLLAVMTPLVLRVFRLGSSYRQMFASCTGVGMMMAATSYVWVVLDPHSAALRIPLPGHLWRIGLLVALVLFGSALAARAAWRGSATTRSIFDDVVTALLVGCIAFAVVSFAITLWYSRVRPDWLLAGTSVSALNAFYFAVLSAALIVPILIGVRRFLPRRLPLAIVGAALFPLPLLAEYFLWNGNRGVAEIWHLLLGSPVMFAARSMPWVVAGAALGWCLAQPLLGKAPVARASE
jgi:hypothetical protein